MPLDLSTVARSISLRDVALSLLPWSHDDPRIRIDYCSGANHEGEILGLADVPFPIGVSAGPELNSESIAALLSLADRDDAIPVFLDSGAFSELKGKAITRRQWEEKMDLYVLLSSRLGPQLAVVAPDKIGDQTETLRRMKSLRSSVQEVARSGATILAPVQPGRLDLASFWRQIEDALEVDGLVPAFPLTRSSPLTPADVEAFVRRERPQAVHLLGMSGRNARIGDVLDAATSAGPCVVTADSAKLPAVRVRSGGPGDPRAPRPTFYFGSGWGDPVRPPDRRRIGMVEADRATAEIEELIWSGEPGFPDYTDLIGTPSVWLGPSAINRISSRLGLSSRDRARLRSNPDRFAEDRNDRAWSEALDTEWIRYFFEATVTERKRRSMKRTMDALLSPSRGRPVPARIALVSCTQKKASTPRAARDLYEPSALFRGARDWVEKLGIPWWILSAEYGLVHPDRVIAPYEKRLPAGRGAAARRRRTPWARDIVMNLHNAFGSLQGVSIEIHAGASYSDPLAQYLEREGALISEPLKGLPIGERLSVYRTARGAG